MGHLAASERVRQKNLRTIGDVGTLRNKTHPSKGVVINLNKDQSSDESVGSNVEEVVQWDRSLHSLKMFQMAVLILSG